MKWYQEAFWRFLQGTFGVYLRIRYNVKVKLHDKYPKKPFIFMANHAHLTDPFILGGVVPYAISYMANAEAAGKLRQVMGKLVGIIPKKKGIMDPKAVIGTFKSLKKGNIVGIFPEGDRSWDGETDKIYDNIVKLIRRAKVPLQLVNISGNYLSWPRWAKTKRRGKIIAEFHTLSVDQINSMGDAELYNKIKNILYNNDVKNKTMQNIKFKGKEVAEGINYLLWICPECMSHDSIYGYQDTIECKSCRKKWSINANQIITPASFFGNDTKDWFDWQKEQIKGITSKSGLGDVLTVSNNIELHIPNNEGDYEYYSKGNLTLYKDRMIFKAFDNDKDDITFNLDDVKFYVDNFNRSFDFSYKEERHKILFGENNSNKWIYFLRHLQHTHD